MFIVEDKASKPSALLPPPGGGLSLGGHNAVLPGPPAVRHGSQAARVLTRRQPGSRLGLAPHPYPDVPLPTQRQLLAPALPLGPQLRLVHGRRPPDNVRLGREERPNRRFLRPLPPVSETSSEKLPVSSTRGTKRPPSEPQPPKV